MATTTNASGSGSNAGIIITAMLIIAALAVAALLYMHPGSKAPTAEIKVTDAPAAVGKAADKVTEPAQ